MWRSVCESASLNVYVPAGSVSPGSDTGPLKVTKVVRSESVPCAFATPAAIASAAQQAASVVRVRLIGIEPPSVQFVFRHGRSCIRRTAAGPRAVDIGWGKADQTDGDSEREKGRGGSNGTAVPSAPSVSRALRHCGGKPLACTFSHGRVPTWIAFGLFAVSGRWNTTSYCIASAFA